MSVENQAPESRKSTPVTWLVIMGLSSAVVLLAFLQMYKRGVHTGEIAPKVEKAATSSEIDLAILKTSTPELVAKGQQLFQINCASCHGPEGKGDGSRAAELNPRPRNYYNEEFKFGALPEQIFNTVSGGSPGTSMPGFALLPAGDRWALVHFVRSQIPNPPQPDGGTPPPATAQTGDTSVADSVSTSTATAPQTAAGPRIPIQLAMQRMSDERKEKIPAYQFRQGAELFTRHCISCHQPGTPGWEAVRVKNALTTAQILSRQMPAHNLPGIKNLDLEEIEAILGYISEHEND